MCLLISTTNKNKAYHEVVLQERIIDSVHVKQRAIFQETTASTTRDGTKRNLSRHYKPVLKTNGPHTSRASAE
jgi:hypothetical protein